MSKEEYLQKVGERLGQIEAKEAELNKTAQKWHGKIRKTFEEMLGSLVENRVYAKEELNRLKNDGNTTVSDMIAELQPTMKNVEKSFQRLNELCR